MEKKLIALPINLWELLAIDAKRCRRNVTKQIEAILTEYFKQESVNITLDSDLMRAAMLRKGEENDHLN